jgi:N-methylhydantoinase B
MPKLEEVVWDGQKHSYRPGADWERRLSDRIDFNDDSQEVVDPVTYEVIRHRLWTINLAHGETVTRISGSPIFQSLDFNMCIMTERGEPVQNAPFLQHLLAASPLAVQYILEHYGEDPGVDDGDVWICNDPWIGAVHQMDAFVGCPVFVDGKLFAWVSNAAHQYDLGGIAPGGWPEAAVDIYQDPVVLPPFKLVEKGEIRRDLEAMYLRQSRMRHLVGLALHAQLGGCYFARDALLETCREFGAATVKAVMRRVLSTAQASFSAKLERIPDGRWSEVRYFDEKLPGDRHTQRVQVNLTKTGGRLVVDNIGTDPQAEGPNGMTFAAFSGSVLGALTILMLHEQLYAAGGAARQVEFDVRPGLLTCVDHPAAVSAGVLQHLAMTNAAMSVIAKMLVCDPALQDDIVAANCEPFLVVLAGANDRGEPFGTAMVEPLAVGSGARLEVDGVDTGGAPWMSLSRLTNVEEAEQYYPLVYLYRKQQTDSPGAGRTRGGGAVKFAFTEYRSSALLISTNSGGNAAYGCGSPGIFGGYPAPTVNYRILHDTNILEMFKTGRMPTDLAELECVDKVRVRGKSTGNIVNPGDVVAVSFGGGAGCGDPLERAPMSVARDVRDGWVSMTVAASIYGVVLDVHKGVDAEATELRRSEIRRGRAEWPPVGRVAEGKSPATGEPPRPVHAAIVAEDKEGFRELTCARCGVPLGGYRSNYKDSLLVSVSAVTDIPMVDDPTQFLDDELVLRRYCCPGCNVLLCTEVVKSEEPLVADQLFYSS